jgi:hypothetical protein
MLQDIKPGTKVQVKVTKAPTNAAARKTIVRLLSKDKTVQAEDARLRKARKNNFRQGRRGGRFWDINVPKQPAVEARAGTSKTITATLDVLSDLKSVSRFVEVSEA